MASAVASSPGGYGPLDRRGGGGGGAAAAAAGQSGSATNADRTRTASARLDGDEEGKHRYRRRGALSSFLQKLIRAFARLLQAMVCFLEDTIEFLGQEPEKRWELMVCTPGGKMPTPQQLVTRARRLTAEGKPEPALRLYARVLEMEPSMTDVMDASAELLWEMGDVKGARDLCLRSIALAPNASADKYITLGHLEQGQPAVEAFERALALVRSELESLKSTTAVVGAGAANNAAGALSPEEVKVKRAELKVRGAAVMTACAKVYLTDLFDEPGSLARCERLLDLALEGDAKNAEACQALADLRLTQYRRGEALVLVNRAHELGRNSAASGGPVPSYDFRLVTSRLFAELSEYDVAADCLRELSYEDECDCEVFYLLGLVCLMSGQAVEGQAALQRAKSLLEEAKAPGSDSGVAFDGTAPLLARVEALLRREAVLEEEKAAFWNPRWWASGGGGGVDDAAASPAAHAAASHAPSPHDAEGKFARPSPTVQPAPVPAPTMERAPAALASALSPEPSEV